MFIRVLTVEQVLVLLLVIEITAVLLHLINTEDARVDLLDPQVVVLELAVDVALLLAIYVLDPHALNISALDYMVPLAVVLPGVWLWL